MARKVETAGQVFGRRLAEAREARGWKQRDLAERSGISQSTIAKTETGKRSGQVTIEEALRLAAALGVSPLHLIVPLEDEARVEVAPKVRVSARRAREWVRGEQPLRDEDDRIFRYQAPAPGFGVFVPGIYTNEARDIERIRKVAAEAVTIGSYGEESDDA